jgi:hypothetical protein
MLPPVLAIVRDSIFPPDPAALRWRAALRATLSGLLTFGVVVLLGEVVPTPIADRILGFAIGLLTSVTVRDPTRKQQAMTMALVPPAAFAVTAVATLLLHQQLLSAALCRASCSRPSTAGHAARAGAHWGELRSLSM